MLFHHIVDGDDKVDFNCRKEVDDPKYIIGHKVE